MVIVIPAYPMVVLGCRFDLPALALTRDVAWDVYSRGMEAMEKLKRPGVGLCSAFSNYEFAGVMVEALNHMSLGAFFVHGSGAYAYRVNSIHISEYVAILHRVRRLWAQHILDHIEETFQC